MKKYLKCDRYVDFDNALIEDKAAELFEKAQNDLDKVRLAYEFVKDEIEDPADNGETCITVTASEVLSCGCGISHAKANLFAALLRSQGIPAGFTYRNLLQHAGKGKNTKHFVYALSTAYLNGKWYILDVSGSKLGQATHFDLDHPTFTFSVDPSKGEYYYDGIFEKPYQTAMDRLEKAQDMTEFLNDYPDTFYMAEA